MCLGRLRGDPFVTGRPAGGLEEQKVNNERRDLALAAARAAARRLLLRSIDIRFNLEDAAEAIHAGHDLTPQELCRLRADADAVGGEIEALADALWPVPVGAGDLAEEENETAMEALSA